MAKSLQSYTAYLTAPFGESHLKCSGHSMKTDVKYSLRLTINRPLQAILCFF